MVISATIGGFIAGTCLAWTSPTTIPLQNGTYGFPVSEDEMGWIGSVMPLGAILGAIITAVFVDRIGRKNLILALVVPIVIGWATMVYATSVSSFGKRKGASTLCRTAECNTQWLCRTAKVAQHMPPIDR